MNDVNDDALDTSGQWNEINLEDLEEEVLEEIEGEDEEEEVLEDSEDEVVDAVEEDTEEEEEDGDDEVEHSEASDEEEVEEDIEETSEAEEDDEKEVERKRSAQARIRELANQKREALEDSQAKDAKILELEKQLKESTKQQSTAHKATLNSQLAQAERELKQAFTDGDPEAFAEAQTKSQELQVKLMAMDAYEADLEDEPEPVQQQTRHHQPSRDEVISMLPESGQDWAMDQEWFMTNRVLTEAAFQISAQLEAEGIDPSDPLHFEELDVEMAKRFPRKFGTKTEEKPKTAKKPKSKPKVASSNNRPPTKRKTAIKLTPEQRAMAQTMGVSEKAYARQLAAQEASEGRGWIEL